MGMGSCGGASSRATAVAGAVVYPPAIGVLSGTIGLHAAMMGTALMAFACGIAAWAAGRVRA